MTGKHTLWLVVAPSGAGKTTLVKNLLKGYPRLQELRSTTTRPMRRGEFEGDPYKFVDRAEFLRLLDLGEFLQTIEIYGELYGSRRQDAYRALAQGPAICVVEVNGVANFKQELDFPIKSIFLDPGSPETCYSRMVTRGNSCEEVAARVAADSPLWAFKDQADFVIPALDVWDTAREAAELMGFREPPALAA